MTPLADAFFAARPSAGPVDRAATEVTLAKLAAAARAALPDVPVDAVELAATLAAHPDAASVEAIGPLAATDAALALACGRGDAAALRAFDAILRDVIPGALAHMKLPPERVDEIAQRARERLLVAEPGEESRVRRYAARGALRGLVGVVATRLALTSTREDRRDRPGGTSAEQSGSGLSPELLLVKEEYRAAFRGAFVAALSELDAHDKNLLRLHLVGGMTLADLGRMYGMHRATVVRHLARIRERIFARTKRALQGELKIDDREFSSLLGLVQSRLDVSVTSLLRDEITPPASSSSTPGA